MSGWPLLTTPGMEPVWQAIRGRLERQGLDNRGRVKLPPLDADSRLTMTNLLRRQLTTQIDLARVEVALRALGVGEDLPAALDALGFPVSPDPARRRAVAAAGRDARAAARALVTGWPEPWAEEWIDGVIRAGVLRRLDRDAATDLVQQVRRVLDAIDDRAGDVGAPLSRTDLAAEVLGHAHALDTGTRAEAAVGRALVLRAGPAEPRIAWEAAGVHLDLTSGPALTWNLPLSPGSALEALTAAATRCGVPVHLSRMALESHPVEVSAGADVLVVENPRVVEAAAQRGVPFGLVSAGGAPSGAVQLLVRQLLAAGAGVRYHGDFDAAGLVLCARMAASGVVPWRMGAADYLDALSAAADEGVDLPVDPNPPPPTPWDPALHDAFVVERRVVHQERLLHDILGR